jgi:colicin import membrane protein
MNNDHNKLCFISALALHVILLLFLLCKFGNSQPVGLNGIIHSNNFINAVAIINNSNNILQENNKKLLKQKTEVKTEFKKEKALEQELKEELTEALKKEKKELKQVIQKNQKIIKQQQQQKKMLEILQNQIKTEQQQLTQDIDKKNNEEIQASGGPPSSGELNEYKSLIIQAISSQWSYSGDANEVASGQLIIQITPTGDVLDVKLAKSSGNTILDRSAQAAVFKASPLPVPKDPKLFDALIKMVFTRYGFG